MTKTFCDRCGVEVKKTIIVEFTKDNALSIWDFTNKVLCPTCFEGLKEYLKPKE